MITQLFKSFLIYGLGTGLSQSILIFLVPVYTEHFSTEEYGAMETIISGFVLLSIFGMLQMESAVGRYYYGYVGKIDRHRHISAAFWFVLLASVVLSSLFMLSADGVSKALFSTSRFSKAIVLALLVLPFANLFNYFNVIIRFEKKPVIYAIITITQILLTVTCSVVMVVYMAYGIESVFVGQLLGYAVGLILYLIYFFRDIVSQFDREIIKKYFSFSLPTVPAVLGAWGNNHANRFVMLSMLSLGEIGLYMVAYKVASVFKLLEIAFKMAWQPFFIEKHQEDGHQGQFKIIALSVIGFVFVFVCLAFLLAKPVVRLFASPEYYGSSELVGWLSLAFGFIIISSVVNIGPILKKKTVYNTYSYFISIVVNFLFLFLLVPATGIKGAAISLAIGNMVLFLSSWFFSEKLYPIFTAKR